MTSTTLIDLSELYHFLPWYPDTTAENFASSTYAKAQFRRPVARDDASEEQGYLAHQLLIARFLSQYTTYQNLLVVHEMGTGKTHVALAALDKIKTADPAVQVLFLAPSQTIVQNFLHHHDRSSNAFQSFLKSRNEAPGAEEKEGDEDDDPVAGERAHRWAKRRRAFGLEAFTYETFAKRIAPWSDAQLVRTYPKMLIICDECHHLSAEVPSSSSAPPSSSAPAAARSRLVSATWTKRDTYKQIFRLFHQAQGFRKTLLMTGTPIRDSVTEIAPLLNLVLPEDRQVPTGARFLSTYFHAKDTVQHVTTYEWKPGAEKQLTVALQGLLSVFKARLPNIEVDFQGEVVPPMKHWKLVMHPMSDFQSYWYEEAWRRGSGSTTTHEEEQQATTQQADKASDSLYKEAIQASLLILPVAQGEEELGVYGEALYRQFIVQRNDRVAMRTGAPWPPDLWQLLTSRTTSYADKVEQLREYSATYAAVIDAILQRPTEVAYVYCSAVMGSGILAFAGLLHSFFGFSIITRASQLQDPSVRRVGKRCLLLNAQVGLRDSEIPRLSAFVNDPTNAEGEFCQVILSTNKTKEGISFAHVRQIHILTPAWNMSDITQAMARGLRHGSHDELHRRGVRPLTVTISLHCAVPVQAEDEGGAMVKEQSIDFLRYARSERKDMNVQLVMRMLMRSAWDCRFWKDRHVSGAGQDYSRDCNYTVCDYKCAGEESSAMDFDTYDLYYGEADRDGIMHIMRDLIENGPINMPTEQLLVATEQRLGRRLRPFEWTNSLFALVDRADVRGPWGQAGLLTYTSGCLSWTDQPAWTDGAFTAPNIMDIRVREPSFRTALAPFETLNQLNPHWLQILRTLKHLLRDSPTPEDAMWPAVLQRCSCLPDVAWSDFFQHVWVTWARSAATVAWTWLRAVHEALPGKVAFSPTTASSMTDVKGVTLAFSTSADGAPTRLGAEAPLWKFEELGARRPTTMTTVATTTAPPPAGRQRARRASEPATAPAVATRPPPRSRSSRTKHALTPAQERRFIFDNVAGFYGIIEPGGQFLIRNVQDKALFAPTHTGSKKDVPSGRVCANFQVKDLHRIVLRLWMTHPVLLQAGTGNRPWYEEPSLTSALDKHLKPELRLPNAATVAKAVAPVESVLQNDAEKAFVRSHLADFFLLSKLPKTTLLCGWLRGAFERVSLLYTGSIAL